VRHSKEVAAAATAWLLLMILTDNCGDLRGATGEIDLSYHVVVCVCVGSTREQQQ
jgi:hypothetical protein